MATHGRDLRGFGALMVAGAALWGLAGAARADEGGRLPEGGAVLDEVLDGAQLHVYLDLPPGFVGLSGAPGAFDEAWLEGWQRDKFAEQVALGRDARVRAIVPWVVDPRDPRAGWVPLVNLLPPIPPVPTRPGERAFAPGERPVAKSAVVPADAPGPRAGALAGKSVYLSAGHGFTWTATLGRWATQRGNTHDIVEDLVSAEVINHYLVTYLRNAGATVFTVRERDLNPHQVIVDADQGGNATVEGGGTYAESGPGWQDTAEPGFRAGLAPYAGNVNPFAGGTTRAVAAAAGAPTAWATWTLTVPADGLYEVYVSYSQGEDRAPDARYLVRHAGGETAYRVDQRRHGGTWMALGRHYFRAGQDPDRGAVVLYNDTLAAPGARVVADAIRLGGGRGDLARGNGSGVASSPTSGRPRYEECSRNYVQYAGAATSVFTYASNDRDADVSSRSRYAAWEHEAGEDAVYLAWHTNAPSPARGTSTYVYGPNGPDGTYNFTGVTGSDDLADAVHGELVRDIRAAFDASWEDRGIYSAYFGEINPSHNAEMPSALLEVAFHDTAADAAWLKEPRFRQVAARALYQGIVKYFAARDGAAALLLPEPRGRVRVVGEGSTSARVSWAQAAAGASGLGGDAAASFRVYRSADGRGWDNGTAAPSGSSALVVDGLAPGVPAYFRVTAVNAGGESFASPVVAVSTSCASGPAPALIVYGFYRLDAASCPREDLSAWGLGTVVRCLQDEVNRYDYVVDHAGGFAAAGVPFDSAEAAAVAQGEVALGGYRAVDWVMGEESTVDETLSTAEQGLLAAWLGQGGGRVLVTSGAELLWDLEAKGAAGDIAFAHTWLGAGYAADSAETWGVTPVGPLAGGAALAIDDGTLGAYRVFYADVLTPLAGASSVLEYDGGAGAAGVWYEGAGYVAVTFGVPLEALWPAAARDALLAGVLEAAEVEALPAGASSGRA